MLTNNLSSVSGFGPKHQLFLLLRRQLSNGSGDGAKPREAATGEKLPEFRRVPTRARPKQRIAS